MHLIASIDLTRLMKTLGGTHPILGKLVERASAAGTIRDDLRNARAALALIAQLGDSAPESDPESRPETSTIIGALFDQAIILYARATTTEGARFALLGPPKDEDDRATHDDTIRLRNSVVAHFGRGEFLSGGPIVKDALVFHVFRAARGQKHQASVYTHRTVNLAAFAARLLRLVERQLGVVECRYAALSCEVCGAFSAAVAQEPDLVHRFSAHEFDFAGFCASPAMAAAFRRQVEAQSISDSDYAVSVPRPAR